MNPGVDEYLSEGCMRCKFGGTPRCKVHNWPEEMNQLRRILLECGLTAEVKWGVPCYTFQNANVVIMSAFREYCALSFFKGALLTDQTGILTKPTENTQGGRQVRFTGVNQILGKEDLLKSLIYEAIENEKKGLKVEPDLKKELPIPAEFQKKLNEIPALREAFESLTPGRKKAYILYFSQAKQATTRELRIEKYLLKILKGKGLYD